ncbi:MAG: phospho-N-acetylmuramoyl-pentapeptide-transferase [Clostridiales Family XIII bacterium]|jgi:phospho-N-acetylmuramoyl-pentapeptide-transferase|nr:phospho-N-acetylmuramoyl-pentapeptide-transferase [Clostridiales Family XIII bacterium]
MNYGITMMTEILTPLLVAMAVTSVVTWRIIPALKKLNTVQNIYEDAPETHQVKQGTPTMGGVAIIAGIFAACIFCFVRSGFVFDLLVLMLMTLGFGLIGFIDDYTKLVKRMNKGLTPKQKLALQIALSLAFSLYLVLVGSGGRFGTEITIPFIWANVDIGWLAIPYMVFILVAMTNAVNLTDGLDGLCAGTAGTVSLFFPLILITSGAVWAALSMGDALGGFAEREVANTITQGPFSDYPTNPFFLGIDGVGTQPSIQFFAAVCGACFGFLLFNRHPAKIFMGDTGSLALGGAIASAAICAKAELLLPIAGVLFVLEALSVIIQVTSYRLRGGKRVFKMAPLHHHFELSGWREKKVVGSFTAFTWIVCVALVASIIVQAITIG